jgi:CRISPR-associated protein Cmr3
VTTAILIEPLDVLLFRDGKPFSAGADHLARSVFPPFPTTIAGFIRSRLYLEAGSNWSRAREMFGDPGGPQAYGDFRLRAAFLHERGVDFVPTPRDCVRASTEINNSLESPLAIIGPAVQWPAEGLKTNFPDPQLRPLTSSIGGAFEPAGGFVSITELFRSALLGEAPADVVEEKHFVEREPRTAIGMDRARGVAGEQLLYAVEFLRLRRDVGFLGALDGVRWPGTGGLDTFGGEKRPVRWTTIASWKPPTSDTIAQRVDESRRFKLVLLTPAVFEQGWHPGRRLAQIFDGAGVKVKMVGAAVDRPSFVGGFDLAANRPKPIRAAAPAGSVYFYEIQGGDPLPLMKTWDLRAVSDWDWEAGMGISAVGAWTPTPRKGGKQ